MAKTIIDVDINDEQFKAFVERFNKYKEELKAVPGEWAKQGEEVDSVAAGFQSMTAAIMAQTLYLHEQVQEMEKMDKAEAALDRKRREGERAELKATEAQAKADREADRAKQEALKRQQTQMKEFEKTTGNVAKGTLGIAKNVAMTTFNILKWVGVGAAFTGLLGAGSLFGLATLARSVGDTRRSAQGLGVSTGEKQAFGLNFNRYVDSDALLGNVANAQSDVSKWGQFAAMGIDPTGKSTADLAKEVQARSRDIYQHSGKTQQEMQARGVLNFVGMDDLRRLGATSDQEFNASNRQYGVDRGMGNADDVSRKWQDFSIQLSRAGLEIKSTFVDALGDKVIPQLTALSVEAAKFVANFLKSDQFKHWMDEAAHAVERFAKWVGSPDAQDKFQKFTVGLGLVVDEILVVAEKLKWLLPPDAAEKKKRQGFQDFRNRGGIIGGWLDDHHWWNPLATGPATSSGGASANWAANANIMNGLGGGSGGSDAISAAAKKWGVSEQLMRNIYQTESNSGRNTRDSPAGAQGPFQFMPGTAARYGVTDPRDLKQASEAAAHYLADLLKMFHGDMEKAAAGYNWGEGNVQSAVKRYGADWKSHLPGETSDYLRKTASPIVVTLNNQTGGSVATSVNQIAQ